VSPRRRPRNASLAARIVTLTLAIVSVTVLASSVLALLGVYGIARTDEVTRLVAYRQLILSDLTGRLDTARQLVETLASTVESQRAAGRPVARTLAGPSAANGEFFDLVELSSAAGAEVQAAPQPGLPRLPASVAGAARTPGRAWFAWETQPVGRLWIVRRLRTRGGDVLVAARVRRGVMQPLVDEIASKSEGRAAVLIDSNGRLVRAGVSGPALDLSGTSFSTEDTSAAGHTDGLVSPTAGAMSGYWVRLGIAPELGWRVLVAEPTMTPLRRARSALLPSALAVLVAAGFAVLSAGVLGRQLVRPIRQFEATATAVSSGEVASPLQIDRDDEIGRLADAFNEMLLQLNAQRELSRLLATSNRLDEVLRGTLAAIVRLLGPDVVPSVYLLDEPGSKLELAATSLADAPPGADIPVDGGGWPARALRREEPLSFVGPLRDVEGSDVMGQFLDQGIGAGLAMQLVAGEKPVGVLVALSRVRREFTEAEREMLRAFSAQAVLAIANSRLFEEEWASRREAEALRDVAELLEAPPDLRAALNRVGAIAGDLLNAGCVSLAVTEHLAEARQDPEFRAWDAVFLANAPDPGSHDPVVVEHPAGTTPLGDTRSPLLLVPLLEGGRRRGLLVLECRALGGGFTERHVSLAGTIGWEMSLALENEWLLRKARMRAVNLETIFRISQAVSSSLQSTVVLNRVLDVVQKIFTAEAVSLMTFDPAKRMVVTAMARGLSDPELLYFEVEPGDDLPGRVFEDGRAEMFARLDGVDTRLARLASDADLHSLLAVPLLARGRSVGVLSVYAREPGVFEDEDLELLQTFATQAALAIDTAELYGREHRVASLLQASILPEQLPAIAGLDLASVYRPASQEAEIGGDYFDVFQVPDGRVVVAVADVVGKGVYAATKTSMIRYSLRGLAAAGLGPAESVGELNRMVAEAGDAADIVTIWVGWIDQKKRTLAYANAGHPPAMMLTPGGPPVERLAPTGPVLGGIASARYREGRVHLDTGSTLLIYTDGVTEARANGKFFGEGRVRRALRSGGTASEVAERLMASVNRFTGNELRDDAAVLVVRLTK
jgi:serine phosphatase RsbU (regulator of sigma subunit)/HAMP domain-containing protein